MDENGTDLSVRTGVRERLVREKDEVLGRFEIRKHTRHGAVVFVMLSRWPKSSVIVERAWSAIWGGIGRKVSVAEIRWWYSCA